MISKELMSQIRRIQIMTRRAVTDVVAGNYESVFRGRGMEFDEVVEYQPGDDVRTIDWNVTARAGAPFVKRYVEERELTVMLLVDLSRSERFGTVGRFKNETAAEFAAVLAYSAIKNNDKVGLITFTDRIEKFIPPKKGVRHVARVIRELLYGDAEGKGTDIAGALEYLNRVTIKKTVAFLLSDFLDSGYERTLRILNRRHDVIAVRIADQAEIELPKAGLLELEDAETGERLLVDTGSRAVRERYRRDAASRSEELAASLRSMGVDQMLVRSDRSYVESLMRFFRMRERRRRA